MPRRACRRQEVLMSDFFYNLVPFAIGAVAVVLVLGLVNMMRGGSPNTSQKLMRLRVLLQFIAITVVMTAIWRMGRRRAARPRPAATGDLLHGAGRRATGHGAQVFLLLGWFLLRLMLPRVRARQIGRRTLLCLKYGGTGGLRRGAGRDEHDSGKCHNSHEAHVRAP